MNAVNCRVFNEHAYITKMKVNARYTVTYQSPGESMECLHIYKHQLTSLSVCNLNLIALMINTARLFSVFTLSEINISMNLNMLGCLVKYLGMYSFRSV